MRILRLLAALLCLTLAAQALARPALAEGVPLVAIVNPSNDLAAVSARDLARIYRLARRRWSNGKSISLYLPPPTSAASNVLAVRLLKLGGEQDIFGFYLRAIFRQKIAEVPEVLSSPQAAIQRIASDPGGIALLPGDEVPAGEPVRVVQIEGF